MSIETRKIKYEGNTVALILNKRYLNSRETKQDTRIQEGAADLNNNAKSELSNNKAVNAV